MAPRIVPGGCDTWEHVFEFEKPPRQRYLSDLTDLAWQRLRHLLVRPPPQGGGHAPNGAGASRSTRSCTSTVPAASGEWCPTTSPSPGRRPTSTSCAGPATAPETVPSPCCAA